LKLKKPLPLYRIVVTFLIIVVAVASTAVVYSFQLADLHNQLIDAQSAKLVNINLGYTDNGQGMLHVSGYVYNSGAQTAYSGYVRVDLFTNNVKTNTTIISFQAINGETSHFVNENLTYTGASPTDVTFTLGWMDSWVIAVP
jgi:hypothetical protein